MVDSHCCPSEKGRIEFESPARNVCPVCGENGYPVPGQTVKAMLSVNLREVQKVEYLFCKTQACPVVYFTPCGEQTFRREHLRERVYQKEPDREDVFVCYCFRLTVGELLGSSAESRAKILNDINSGIKAGQCACVFRNPQGSCCLGNVRRLMG